MSDVTIVPNPQVQTVASAGGQPAQTQQPGLAQGSLVSGTIAGKDANGNYLLKTSQGTLSIRSSTPLTYNSDVTISIGANSAGSTNARIVSVNGEPFSEFATPEPETSDSVSPTLLTAPQDSTPSSPAATVLRAVVLSAPALQIPNSPTLAQGSAVNIRLAQTPASGQQETPQPVPETPAASISVSAAVAVQPEQTAQSPQPAALQAPAPAQPAAPTSVAVASQSAAPVETELASGQTVGQTPQTESTQTSSQQPQTPQQQTTNTQQQAPAEPKAPAAPATPTAPVSAAYNVYTKQSAVTPTAAPSTSSPAPAATSSTGNTTIPAQIESADENGTLTLQTPLGAVTVKASSLPGIFSPGTNVTLELPNATPAQSAAPAPFTELASSWDSLKEIVSLVGNTDSETASALLARLPQIGPDFTASSTTFITAMLQGDARKLLGDDTVDNLHNNGRQDLADRFSGEVANLSASFTAAPQRQMPGWQMLFLPFVYQEQLQQARIYVKREPQKKEGAKAKSNADTRFVVEVDLTELGPLQMDGLVRKKEKATAFDLVIRSHHAFSQTHQAEITGIYNSAAQLTGFKGSVSFQVTRDFPVKPLEDAAQEGPHGITV